MRNNKQKSMPKIFFKICVPNLQIGNSIRKKKKTISVLETSHSLELLIHGEYMFWMYSWKKKSISCKISWAFIYDHTKTRSTYACQHHHKTLLTRLANLFNVKYMKVLFSSANYRASRHEIIVLNESDNIELDIVQSLAGYLIRLVPKFSSLFNNVERLSDSTLLRK